MHEEIKSMLVSGNACNHSAQNFLFSSLLSKNLKIKIHKIIIFLIIFPGGLYSCETWSLTLREKQRLRVFEERIFGPKKDEMVGGWRKQYSRKATTDFQSNMAY
jgi:hypothetical protein